MQAVHRATRNITQISSPDSPVLESSLMQDIKYWVAFNRIPGIGRARYAALEAYFGSLAAAWTAGPSDLRRAGLDKRSIASIQARRPSIDPDTSMSDLQARGITPLTWHDDRYPDRLKQIYDKPPVIYVRGEIKEQDDWGIAVVGTRQPTTYGREMAQLMSTELVRNGITVVSGLARGIDSVAHHSALDAGGRTIAVQACGLDMVYPPEHRRLADQIAESGAVISDYPLDTRPRPDYFPRRNRIMSGLTLGTLVIEADEKSGALITASYALEHNREVFALPGTITSPKSKGPNRLIQEGAKLVTSIEDVLEELNLRVVPEQLVMQDLIEVSTPEADLLQFLSREPVHIDEVTRQCALPVSTVSSTLAMMELKGIVKQVGSMTYVKIRETRPTYPTPA